MAPRWATWVAAIVAVQVPIAVLADPRPLVPVWDASGISKACEEGLARTAREIEAARAKRGAGDIFGEWNRIRIHAEDVVNPVYLMSEVHPDPAARAAAGPCLQRYTALLTRMAQDEALFERVQAVRPATPRQAKVKKDLLEGFEDGGVALPPGRRARAREIFDRMEQLRQDFDRRIREDPTRVAISPGDMEGLPASYLDAHAASRGPDGTYRLGFKYSSYTPFMANAKQEAARRRYYLAKMREGGEENLATLQELYELRQELARLFGLATYADFALRRSMAGTPAAVWKFLQDVHASIEKVELRELAALRAAKVEETGDPAATIRPWDVAYYEERVRHARYDVDEEKLRHHFPTRNAIDYMMRVAERLYGVRFTERAVAAWHRDVRYFDLADAKGGRYLAGIYLDLAPREGKYNHAFALPLRRASTAERRTPLAVLVGNFDREGLTHRDFEILMHEFGHVLHIALSRTEFTMQSATNVKQDFVEAPSQMFEEWARRPEALALMAEACPRCPRLSADEIRRIDDARRFGHGIRFARQWLQSTFDMEMSTRPRPPLALWRRLEGATPLGTVEGTLFPASFNHLSGSYAAGYYGYMWSAVLALDMLSPFEGHMLDPGVGRRYRDIVLANGSQEEEASLVKKFLGREPSSDAFFAEITGKR